MANLLDLNTLDPPTSGSFEPEYATHRPLPLS